MSSNENAPDQGAFSIYPGLSCQDLRSKIQALEYLTGQKLLSKIRMPQEWSAAMLYKVHRDIFGEFFPEAAGRNRTGEANFGNQAAPPPERLEGLAAQLIAGIQGNLRAVLELPLGSLERMDKTFLFAAVDHAEMIHIHPFIDGNGRWARLITNAFLIDAGLPCGTIIRHGEKAQYIAALDRCINKKAPGDLANQMLSGYNRVLQGRRQS